MFRFVKYAVIVGLIGSPFFLKPNVALAGGGFSGSCQNIQLNGSILTASGGGYGSILTADCGDGAGGYRQTSVDLNGHITNNNATLAWQKDGGYAASVDGCYLSGATLSCRAYAPNGYIALAEINLDEEIANYNGNLTVLDGF